jgi:transcriptional regulator with XRE-family HTH domain
VNDRDDSWVRTEEYYRSLYDEIYSGPDLYEDWECFEERCADNQKEIPPELFQKFEKERLEKEITQAEFEARVSYEIARQKMRVLNDLRAALSRAQGNTPVDDSKLNKWERALGATYDVLCELERQLGNRLTVDDARLLGRAIMYSKYWKQPEFDERWANGNEGPEDEAGAKAPEDGEAGDSGGA